LALLYIIYVIIILYIIYVTFGCLSREPQKIYKNFNFLLDAQVVEGDWEGAVNKALTKKKPKSGRPEKGKKA